MSCFVEQIEAGALILQNAGAGLDDPHDVNFACGKLSFQALQLLRQPRKIVGRLQHECLIGKFISLESGLRLQFRSQERLTPNGGLLTKFSGTLVFQGTSGVDDRQIHFGAEADARHSIGIALIVGAE